MIKVSLAALSACLLCAPLRGEAQGIAQGIAQRGGVKQADRADKGVALPTAHTYADLPEGPNLPDPFPSGTQGPPVKPSSAERLTLDGSVVSQQIARAEADVQDRMSGIHIGSGNLNVEKTPDATLRAVLDHDAKMRQIGMLRSEVDASIGLWGAAYGGPREDAKAEGSSVASPSLRARRPAIIDPEIARQRAKAERDEARATEKADREEAQRQAEADARAHDQEILDEIAGRKRALGQIPPVVSSIYGATDAPKAFILIPYMGSVEVTHVGQTFSLIDNSTMKITALSVDGVYASHNGGPSRRIGSGSSVPTAADAVAMFNAMSGSGISSGMMSSGNSGGGMPGMQAAMPGMQMTVSGMRPGMSGVNMPTYMPGNAGRPSGM